MTQRVERFKQRQTARARLNGTTALVLLPSSEAVRELAIAPVDESYVNGPSFAQAFAAQSETDRLEVQRLMDELASVFEQHKFDQTMGSVKLSVLQNMAGPFGLGKIVSAYDRTGGNVDTVQGVRNGVYVDGEEEAKFANRGPYNSDEHHQHPAYKDANRDMIDSLKAGRLVDGYTGEHFKLADKEDSRRKPSLDHVIAAKSVHDDAGRVLAEIDSAELSNIRPNLTGTAQSINSSMKDMTAAQFTNRLDADSAARKTRLKELSDKKDDWTDKERGEFKKLDALDKVDANLMAEKEAQAREAIDRQINETYYGSDKFKGRVAITSVAEGGKLGFQQAMGEALIEFFAAVFDEVTDLQRNGRSEQAFLKEAKVRLGRVAKRVAGKWDSVFSAFAGGFLSGLLSNLVTTLINVFVTTGKRLVRVIREGLLSLLRAIKLIAIRPPEMTHRQALHEASKLIVGAGIVIGGIALEEVVSKHLELVPWLGGMAEPITAAIVGSLTAIATAVAVYWIDKADLLGVNEAERYAAISTQLEQRIGQTLDQVECAHRKLLTMVCDS